MVVVVIVMVMAMLVVVEHASNDPVWPIGPQWEPIGAHWTTWESIEHN